MESYIFKAGDRIRAKRNCLETNFYSSGAGGVVKDGDCQDSLYVAFDTGDYHRASDGHTTWFLCAHECVLALPTD